MGHVFQNIVNTVVDVVQDIGGGIADVGNWIADVGTSIGKTSFNWVKDLSDIYTLVTHPDDYLKKMTYDTFQVFAQPTGEAIGNQDLANQITYYAMVAAILVAAWYIGPEVSAAIDYLAMATIEYTASVVVLSASVAAVMYYSLTAIAMVSTSYLMMYATQTALYGVTEAYFVSMYGLHEGIRHFQLKRQMDTNYASSLMDGTAFNWLAGGIALNAVMAGGDVSNNSFPNDPYSIGLSYETKGNDIGSGVRNHMLYEHLAGGSMFGLNGTGYNPYNPLSISVV